MSKIVDPDSLDRWQICVDPGSQKLSIRGLGTQRHAMDQTGDSDGTTTFTDAGANFTTDGVVAGDILTIISDPANDGGIIGHYRVVTVGTTTLTVERTIPASSAANLTYKINAKQTPGSASPQVCDGVVGQVLFSFLKEEWRTLASGLGNAVDLNKFAFPMVFGLPTAQYILGGVNGDAASAWTFNDLNGVEATDLEGTTRQLLRDMGWQERDASDAILREYANYTTLGVLDSDAQAKYQQGRADQDPVDFKLKGAVNQAVLTLGPPTTPGNVAFAATTITRTGGDWTVDGFKLGDYVTIRNAEDSANDGTFGPITGLSSTVITIASASFTINADDDTATFLVNHKFYTKLIARKKGRSYSSAVHADAGISTVFGIFPQINSFPLAHSNDPAITLEDGVLSGGDGTTEGDVFQKVESHTTGADGVTQAASAAATDSFTFTSAGSTFNSTARGSVQVLRPGDSLEITSGSDQGVYEIKSIDSATQVTLFKEPTKAYVGGENTLSFVCRTGVRDVGAANATLTDVDGDTGTLTSAGSTFNADNGLGDRAVAAGDIVEVHAGTDAVIGYYKVISVDSATQLTLDTSDQVFGGETNQSYRIWRPGMFLQRFDEDLVASGMTDGLNINGAGNPDTFSRTGGSWITDGFVVGAAIRLLDAEDAANIGSYIVGTPTPTATVLTLIASESVTTNTDDDVAVNGNVTGEYGIIRTINLVKYPFHWRLFANGGTLAQVFQFLQRELRRTTDIDGGSGVARGDITDLLMSFAAPTGTTLDLYPDDLSMAESNNVTFRDLTGDDRTNAWIVGILLDVNANLINSAGKRLTMYFTTNPGGNFGTNNAIVVDDKDGADIDYTAIGADIQTSFDYTNNAQGGRTPDQPAAVTVVALGDDLAQHILVTTTITKVNSLVISVQPALERNYSNP